MDQVPDEPDAIAERARRLRKSKRASNRKLLQVLEPAFDRWPTSVALAEQLVVLYRASVLDARRVFDGLLARGGQPTGYLCSALITAYGNDNQPEGAREIFEWMKQEAEHHPELHPDAITCSALITAYGNDNQPEGAREIFEWMKQEAERHPELRPDVITCSSLITAYGNDNQPEGAREIFEWMKQEAEHHPKLRPDVITCNSLVTAYGNDNQPEGAREIFEWMKQEAEHHPELRPNMITCSALITAYANNKQPAAAHEIFKWMQQETIRTNLNSLNPGQRRRWLMNLLIGHAPTFQMELMRPGIELVDALVLQLFDDNLDKLKQRLVEGTLVTECNELLMGGLAAAMIPAGIHCGASVVLADEMSELLDSQQTLVSLNIEGSKASVSIVHWETLRTWIESLIDWEDHYQPLEPLATLTTERVVNCVVQPIR